MRISVIIPCCNGVADTRLCLRALHQQVGLDASLEILVVDNASADATGELGRDFADVKVLPQLENLGFAGGVNRALAQARGALCLILNNDTAAAPHMLARLVHGLQVDNRIAMAAPVSNHVKGPAQIDVGGHGANPADRHSIESCLDDHCADRLEDVATLSGLCLLFRHSLLDQVAGFDERFGAGNFEDDDFCLRVRLLGSRLVLVRDAFLYHRGHSTFRALGLDIDHEIRQRRQTLDDKWRDDPAGRVYLARLDDDHAAAAAASHEALRHYPAWPDPHLALGRQLGQEGQPEAAVPHLEAFLRSCPLHIEARIMHALVSIDAGELELGLQHFRNTLDDCYFSSDQLAQALCQLARRCMTRGDHGTALRHLEVARDLAPEDAEPSNLIGAALMEQGNLTAARTELERAHQLGSASGTTNLGVLLWRIGDRTTSLRMLEAAVELDPHDQVASGNLEQVRKALGP